MNFNKFFPLLKKDPKSIVSDQPLVDAVNPYVEPDIADSGELLGIEQSQQIPFASGQPAPTPVSGGQALASEKAKEIQTSKEIKSEDSLDRSPASNQAPVAPQDPDFNSLLAHAQDNQANNSLMSNLLKAGQTVGSALANNKADYTVADGLQAQSGQDVQNVLQQMKSQKDQTGLNDDKLLRDPNSDVSKAFRATLAKLGIPYSDKTTAWDAKAMGINPQNLLMQEKATAQAREMKEMMLGDRARQQAYGATDRSVSNLYNSKDYKSFTNAKDAQAALDHAISTGDKTAQGTAFMSFAKFAQNDDSVVRSEDMKTLAGHYNYSSPQEMLSKLSAKAHGGNFSENELKAMKEVIAKGIGLKGQRVNQMLNPIKGKIQGSGLNMDEHIDPSILSEFDTYNPKAAAPQNPAAPKTAQAGGQLVERKTKDGQIALFDPTTQQFVKYKGQ
jgi:hypothetical protein